MQDYSQIDQRGGGLPAYLKRKKEQEAAKKTAGVSRAAETARRERGTPLTEYGVKRKALSKKLALDTTMSGESPRYTYEEIDKKVSQQITAPTLLADEEAIAKKKRKTASSGRLRGGRMSTILSETLG